MADETDTLRDLLEQGFDEAPQVETPEPIAVVEAEPAKVDDRPRAADGKFVSPNAEKPILGATEQPKVSAAPEANQPIPGAAEEPTWKRPPQSWKKDVHEPYGTLPPAIQEYVHQREQEMQRGIGEARQAKVFADQIQRAVEPFRANIATYAGGDVAKAAQALFNADHQLRTLPPQEKVQYLARLAQNYGVDFGQVTELAAPVANQFNAEIQRLKGVIAGLETEKLKQIETQDQQEQKKAVEEIAKFKDTHPDFEALRPKMAKLLDKELAGDLEEAYQIASRMYGGTSTTAPQADVVRRQTKDQAAKAARSAAVSVKSSTPGTVTKTNAQDRRAMLSESFDGIEGRL